MRVTFPVMVLLGFASGCEAECGSAHQLDGLVFEVFSTDMDLRPGRVPARVAEGILFNGPGEWSFKWESNAGPVNVTMDGQEFLADASWDTVECGHFGLDFAGEYEDTHGARHSFDVSGEFVTYGERLEGQLTFAESWRDGTADGVVRGLAQVRGVVVR
jgi:hypothetical protein